MDRYRGFSGPQFEERPHLVQQPFDRGRKCFGCGQLGHLCRDCPQRVGRGFGINGGGLLGRGYPHQGWINPGATAFRQIPIYNRDLSFFINREEAHQGWQPQVIEDFGDNGFRDRNLGDRNLSCHTRVGDRVRDRRAGWVDNGAQPHLSVYTRPGEQISNGEVKNFRNRGPLLKGNSSQRNNLPDGDISARSHPNLQSTACEKDRGRESWKDEKGEILVPAGETLSELPPGDLVGKWLVDQEGNLETGVPPSTSGAVDIQVKVNTSSSEPPCSAQGNEVGYANLKLVAKDLAQSARPAQSESGNEDGSGASGDGKRLESTADPSHNQVPTGAWKSSRQDCNALSQSSDGNDRSNQQRVREEASCKKVTIEENVCSDTLIVDMSKAGWKENKEIWSKSDNSLSGQASVPSRCDEVNRRLEPDTRSACQAPDELSPTTSSRERERPGERNKDNLLVQGLGCGTRVFRQDREGLDWPSEKDYVDRERERGGQRGARRNTQYNNSYPGHGNRSGFGYRGGDMNYRRDELDIGGRRYPTQNLEEDRRTRSPYLVRDFYSLSRNHHETSSSAVKPAEEHSSVIKAMSPVPGVNSCAGREWQPFTSRSGQSSRGWSGCADGPEQEAKIRSGMLGCRGWFYIDKEGITQGPLGLTDLKALQLQSDHLVKGDGSNEWVTLERAGCARAAPTQKEVSSVFKGVPTQGSVDRVDALQAENVANRLMAQSGIEGFAVKEEYHIDARVEKLMWNFPLVPGREQDIVADALMAALQRVIEDDFEFESEDSPRSHGGFPNVGQQWKDGDCKIEPELFASVPQISSDVLQTESKADVPAQTVLEFTFETAKHTLASPVRAESQVNNMHCWKFPTAGGDWRLTQTERIEPSGSEKLVIWRKEVINKGISLCEGEPSGTSDPRRQVSIEHHADGLERMRFEVPSWACRHPEKMDHIVDDLPAHYHHPAALTPKKHVPLSKSQFSNPSSLTTKGALATPRAPKAPAAGLKTSSGSTATLKIDSDKGNKPLKKLTQTKNSRQKLGDSTRELIVAPKQITATVTSKIGGLVPGATGNKELHSASLSDHSEKIGKRKPDVPSVHLSSNAGRGTAAQGSNVTTYKTAGASIISARGQKVASVVLRRHELQLESGIWHYTDGAGREKGPFVMSALRTIVAEGRLPDGASVFRKSDNTWVPVSLNSSYSHRSSQIPLTSAMQMSVSSVFNEDSRYSPSEPLPPAVSPTCRNVPAVVVKDSADDIVRVASLKFHNEHPQFLGYTNGKLHELVMKTFIGTFSGFLSDSLDLWRSEKRSVVVPAIVATPDESPASTSPLPSGLIGNTCDSTSMEPLPGLQEVSGGRSGGRKSDSRMHVDDHSKLWEESEKVKQSKEARRALDQEVRGKRSTSFNQRPKSSSVRSSTKRKISSPLDHLSIDRMTSMGPLTAQHSADSSPRTYSTSVLDSPQQIKSAKSNRGQASDGVLMGDETDSLKEDYSPSTAEHNAWIDDEEHDAEDMQLCHQNSSRLCLDELDRSKGDKASEPALTPCGIMGLPTEASFDQEVPDVDGGDHIETKEKEGEGGLQQEEWGVLSRRLLMKIFRRLCGDPRSLAAAMATCHFWRESAQLIKVSAKHVDLSGLGVHCDDKIISALKGYGGGKLKHLTLNHCVNVSAEALGHLLHDYSSISVVDICGCLHLRELKTLHPHIRWLWNPVEIGSHHCAPISQGRDSHRKVRKLKLIGTKRDIPTRGSDGCSVHSMDENVSRDKSTEDEESMVADPMIIDSPDPVEKDLLGLGHPREAKRLKVSKEGRSGLSNGHAKDDGYQDHLNGGERGSGLQVKRDLYTVKRKVKAVHKLTFKKQAHVDPSLKKGTSPIRKFETSGKDLSSSPKTSEKDLEKELASALKTVMEADFDQVFFHLASGQMLDARGTLPKTVQMDFSTVQKKLKMGVYGGKDGVKAFKDDLLQPLRSAFRLEHDSELYKAAGRIFKVAHQVGQQLDEYISGPRMKDSSQGQSKALGNGSVSARNHSKVKSQKHVVLEKRFGTKRAWEAATVNGRSVKGKVIGILNREFASADLENEGDRQVRMKRNRWSESEAESSDEDDDVDETLFEEPEEEDTETSGSDVASESEGADEAIEDDNYETESDDGHLGLDGEGVSRDWWGARMTKAAMVPPLTRKYEVIEEYRIVEDKERVAQKMKVELPDDYEEKLQEAKEKGGDQYAHLDFPDIKEFRPRKRLGEEVVEQEVYGIDPFTYNLLLNTMPADTVIFTEKQKQLFIEERLLRVLNKKVSEFTGSGRAPMEYPLEKVITHVLSEAHGDQSLQAFCSGLLKNMRIHPGDKYVAYRKGLGVVCNNPKGFHEGDFVVEFFGEVYPPWRWYEKQDGIRSLQKKDKEPAPEFYNIVFERPKGDASGYDVLVIDAMHKANFASRLCHSCRPNCEAKVTAVNGNYMIGVYTLRKIEFGEELTFDYCCVTESKEEHDSSVCLCGSQGCKGSYLCYTGPGAYDEVLKEYHGILDRHNLLLQACTSGRVTSRELEELKQAGLGSSLLHGLPDWVIKYAAGIVSYLNFERQRLPDELMKAEAQKHTGIEIDRQDIEVQTEGVYNQRLQNLAITLDKVRYILSRLYGQASTAPPPLRMLEPHELIDFIWKGKKSVVGELLQCMAVHAPEGLADLTRQIKEHNPPQKGDIEGNLRRSLLWLRDKLRNVPATCKSRHDAAADLIHLYAYTKHFFTNHDYGLVESPSLLIYACDLGPKHSGPGPFMWRKTYSKNYVWGQLISWFRQTSADPGASLVQDRRGCLMLPDISSCYARTPQHDVFRRSYSNKDRKKMLLHMETRPQKKWTIKYTPEFWNFKSDRGLYGSPMLDAVVSKSKLNKECIDWLKARETVFHGPWDEE